mmetsp:Transcript_24600/g.54387  ORF Transcript_24600/g.54387 Transcript_24600/m.54387 type:complete len:89 (+) Transcript_24600:86-352(+)
MTPLFKFRNTTSAISSSSSLSVFTIVYTGRYSNVYMYYVSSSIWERGHANAHKMGHRGDFIGINCVEHPQSGKHDVDLASGDLDFFAR